MNKFFGHLNTINNHKRLITIACFKCSLYKQGLLHDLSKYAPIEFLAGVKYWEGNASPINNEKKDLGYSNGWLHHKGRNKHHFEYWIDYAPNPHNGLIGIKMPKKYVAEMVLDRMCASKNYMKDKYTEDKPLEYYVAGKDFYVIDEDTDFLTTYLLTMLKDKGEKELIHYIKHILLKQRDKDYFIKDGKIIL